MNTLDKRIKRIMDDIIDVAYADVEGPMRLPLHTYTIEIMPKEVKSSSGMYNSQTKHIQVYNARLGQRHMAKCCIHELSHHIDQMLHGNTGHQAPFYEAYARLAYAAIDMGILTVDDFYHDTWSSDQNKVRRIMDAYVPHAIDYTLPSDEIICVKNCYEQREHLKAAGYRWNSIEQVWEKQIDDESAEVSFLASIGCREYYKQSASEMHVSAITYIQATGRTYDQKDLLKADGFFFHKDSKTWRMKLQAEHAENVIKLLSEKPEYSEITFSFLKG
jgi:hypothetical protein